METHISQGHFLQCTCNIVSVFFTVPILRIVLSKAAVRMAALAGICFVKTLAVVTTKVLRKRGLSPAETCISQIVLISQDGFKLPSENYPLGGCTGIDDLCPINPRDKKYF